MLLPDHWTDHRMPSPTDETSIHFAITTLKANDCPKFPVRMTQVFRSQSARLRFNFPDRSRTNPNPIGVRYAIA
jgi:hypothetical protein